MVAPLESLPLELYEAIISQIPGEYEDLQQTILALTRAIPRSPVPIYRLFERVRLKHGDQVFQLYRRLRKSREEIHWIRYFSLESWSVDADVLVNLIAILPDVKKLHLSIGPNFAPEHLEEMFEKPREGITLISLRFRPYVQKATYYQFLKGAYFDSTLQALSRWPAADLPTLSIMQDLLDPSIAPTGFAQPLVFFRLDPVSTLARSPLLENLTNLRLRIPARQAARFLYAPPRSLPSLEVLDMSTCNVLESDVEGMLGRFGRLKSLVLDGCYIVNQRADVQEGEALGHWATLGKVMALAGVKYAREREKKLKLWLEANYARATQTSDGPSPEPEAVRQRRPRRGRRGLATAAISLRNSPPSEAVPLPKRPPPGASSQGPKAGQIPRIRILPPLPTIQNLATTPPAHMPLDKHDAIRAEFENGWVEGIAQLSTIYGRLRQSWKNGIRVVRFDSEYQPEEDDGDGEDGLAGLVDVQDEETFLIPVANQESSDGEAQDDGEQGQSPALCLVGAGQKEGHLSGCGHQIGWQIWRDEL